MQFQTGIGIKGSESQCAILARAVVARHCRQFFAFVPVREIRVSLLPILTPSVILTKNSPYPLQF